MPSSKFPHNHKRKRDEAPTHDSSAVHQHRKPRKRRKKDKQTGPADTPAQRPQVSLPPSRPQYAAPSSSHRHEPHHSRKRRRTKHKKTKVEAAEILEDNAPPTLQGDTAVAAGDANDQATIMGQEDQQAVVLKMKKSRTGKRSQGHSKHAGKEVEAHPRNHLPAWSLSKPVGGRFLDVAPQMSTDESYVISATESSITAYSASTSLPAQTLYNDRSKDFFTCFALSRTKTDAAWVCTRQGFLTEWNFLDGQVLSKMRLIGAVQSIKVEIDANNEESIYALEVDDKQWSISAYRASAESPPTVLLRHNVPIRSLDVREDGSVITAITATGVLVGIARQDSDGATLNDYIWQDVTCSEPPTCFDVKVQRRKQKKAAHLDDPLKTWHIDVVVGCLKGSIYVFQDILRPFRKQERAEPASSTPEQQLHWHREAVGAVTWSLDGQYIVSGGMETVLVLWQLETGRKQFLPNLESPIQDIAMSPNGASYVIRLADNSVMVLSTTELSPTCHIAGVQTTSFSRAVTPAQHLPTVDMLHQFGEEAATNIAAIAINPRAPDQLLASVPAHQARFSLGGPLSPAPYLQTYNLNDATFVARQALTRTNATNANLGPEGNSIAEPNTKYLQTSHDGRWLVTVDEWHGPFSDVRDLDFGDDLRNSLESKLRFWLWNEEDNHWMLNSRIDEPHRLEHQQQSLPVLALASDPSTSSFATLGADSTVRTWTLKSKLKNGKVIRGEVGPDAKGKSRTIETWWAAESTVYLEQSAAFDSYQTVRPDRGTMAFSNDGSMLAVCQYYDVFEGTSPVVHFIDVTTNTLYDSRTGLHDGVDGIYDMDFLGQYLIIMGRESAVVWDVTTFALQHSIPLLSDEEQEKSLSRLVQSGNTMRRPRPIPHLAVNVATNTFAIAMPERSRTNRKLDVHPLLKYRTSLSIYSPNEGLRPVYQTVLPRTTMALLSAGGLGGLTDDGGEDFMGQNNGYVILDLGAEVRTIKREYAGLGSLPTPPPSDVEVPTTRAEEDDAMAVVHDDEAISADTTEDLPDAMETGDEDEGAILPPKDTDTRPVVRREQLAEVFEHPSLAMPSMNELLDSVLKLYAEKPVRRSPPPEKEQEKVQDLDELVRVDVPGEDSEEDDDSDSSMD